MHIYVLLGLSIDEVALEFTGPKTSRGAGLKAGHGRRLARGDASWRTRVVLGPMGLSWNIAAALSHQLNYMVAVSRWFLW